VRGGLAPTARSPPRGRSRLGSLTLWNGSGKVTVPDVVGTLDGGHLAAFGTLLVSVASGPSGIDRWLATNATASPQADEPPPTGCPPSAAA